MSSQYYKLSGRFSPAGLAIALGLGVTGAVMSSAVYAYVMAWIPLVYFLILFVFGYSMLMGMLASLALRIGKVRNSAVGALVGLIIGVAALYWSWVFWILAESSQEVFIWAPDQLWAAIQYLGDKGVWSIKGATPTGVVLFAFWAVEAAAIVGMSAWSGFKAASNNAFCEKCDCWMEDGVPLGFFSVSPDANGLKGDLEAGRLDRLKALSGVTPDESHHTIVSLEDCAKCQGHKLLTLTERVITFDDKGNQQNKDTVLVNRLLVEEQLAGQITDFWKASLEEAAKSEEQAAQVPVTSDDTEES
ncbi:MAG TPA: hypothetical protein EYO33_19515 [Phycisphaerales bacterium]|nr:hypothetical protein [Phycisphaerales bacterium]